MRRADGWRFRALVAATHSLLYSACGAPQAQAPSVRAAVAAPSVERVPGTIVAPDEAMTGEELLALGRLEYERGAYEAALVRFERLLAAEPQGHHAAEAAYRAAECHEQLGRHESAARAFATLVTFHSRSPLARRAALRASRLWVYVGNLAAAEDASDFALRRFERVLSPQERIAAYGAKALGALAREDDDAARHWTGKARIVVEEHRLDQVAPIARDVAQMYFALGELRRRESEAIGFDPVPADFPLVFEARARLLLDAQAAYAEVMRAEDARWTAMAGTRVGELYERLHSDVLAMPRPVGDAKLSPLFESALRLRYAVLLQKGLDTLDRTLAMAARTGERSAWVERAEQARARMAARWQEENRQIEASPYSRETLSDVLDDLQRRRNRQDAQPPPPAARSGPDRSRH